MSERPFRERDRSVTADVGIPKADALFMQAVIQRWRLLR